MRTERFAYIDRTGRPLALALALFICGTAGLQAQLGQNKKDSGAPDMTTVQDVLSGKRTLLRDDDIQYGTISTSVGQGYIIKTENSTIIRPTAVPGSTTAPPGGYLYKPSPFYGIATGVGRMQAIGSDTSITLQPTASGWQVDAVNYGTPGYNRTYILPTSYQPYGTNYTQVVMGDFDGSYTKQAVLYYSSNSSVPTVAMRIARAPKDTPPDDPQLQFGPEYVQQGAGIGPVVNVGTLTVGDFNGDGYDEIAAMLTDNHTLVVFTVDRTTYELKLYATMGLNWNNTNFSMSPVALAAGRYRDNVELVAIGQITGGPGAVTAVPISVTISTDGNGNPSASFSTQAPQKIVDDNPPFSSAHLTHIQAQAAAAGDWASATGEQLVYTAYPVVLLSQIGVLSFAPDWTVSINSLTPDTHCFYGLAVGNFDHRQSDSSRNPFLQIAVLENDTNSCSADSVEQQQLIRIYDIKPLSSNPPVQSPPSLLTQTSEYKFDGVHDNVAATISFGDLQGRSITVGAPSIVTITDQRQPDIILGVPPMHADWILPPPGTTQPGCTDQKGNPKYCLYNFTFIPTEEPSYGSGFNTAFTFSDTKVTNSERNATTSWGIGVKQTVGVSTTVSDPGVDSVSVDIKNTAQYTHDSTVSKTYNKYQSFSQSINDSTGSTDHIFYTERTHNVYYYPILGAAGCPDANPNCNSSERRYISYSVPDNVQRADEDGTLKSWYNPVQEPGNVFSYPWTFAQLSGQFSEPVTALTNSGCQATGGTDQEYLTAKWSNGSSTTQSAASSNQFSDEISTTISDTAGVKDVESATFSYTLDITGSTSLKTLNVGKQVLDSSEGINTNKPGFPESFYEYGFRNYILGIGSSNPAYQTFANLNPDPNSNATLPDQKTGPLVVGYLANPLAASGGQDLNCGGDTALAWQTTYNKPDVALNHPQRLTWSKSSRTVTFNGLSSAVTDPRLEPFYKMKGFFVYKPTTSGGMGPIIESAQVKDSVSLAVRVYNYSLTPIDPSATVHVRFYGQLVCQSDGSCTDPATNKACQADSLCGSSFLINDVSLTGGIHGFAETDQPNWVLANTTFNMSKFDQTKNGNVFMVFWVLTWIQDPNGNKVEEMPDHGLIRNPANLSFTSITQTLAEPHSNNVGLYGYTQPFYISAPAPSSAPGARPTSGPLTSIKLAKPGKLLLESEAVLRSTLQAGSQAVGPVTIKYFDGNPQRGGTIIDIQKVQHIDPNSAYHHRTFYTPQSCGLHSLYTVAEIRGQASVNDAVPMQVTIEPESALDALANATITAGFKPAAQTELIKLIRYAQDAFDWDLPSLAHKYLKAYTVLLQLAARGMNASVAVALTNQANTVVDCTSSDFPLLHRPGWLKGTGHFVVNRTE